MIVDGGNVGIGTTSPKDKLDLYDADDNVGIYFHTATSGVGGGDGLRVGLNNTHAFVWNYENTPLSFGTNGSQKATILANGNVGIGATSPLRKLHVAGNFAVNAGTGEYYGVYISGGEGANPNILIGDWHNSSANINWNSSGNYLRIDAQHSTSGAPIVFSGNDSAIEYMRISSTGNVGIGDAGPNVKLQVSTNSPSNNVAAVIGDGWVGNSSYHKEGGLLLISGTSQDATQTGAGIAFQTRNTQNTNYWKSSMIMDRDGAIRFTLGGAGTVAGSEDFTILSGGYVGIGTTSPSKPLDVRTDIGVLIKGASGSTNAKISLLPASGGRQYDLGNVGSDFRIFDASANVTRMYFDNDGNTGIGTTSPSSKLSIRNDGTQLSLQRADATGTEWKFYSWTSGLNIFPASASEIYIGRDGATTNLQLHNGILKVLGTGDSYFTGNVGIGTTNSFSVYFARTWTYLLLVAVLTLSSSTSSRYCKQCR